MLPTEPQSLIKVILGSITAYRKNILLLVPISMVLSALYVASHVLVKIDQIWMIWAKTPLLLLTLFCVYGAISFVYDLLSKQKASYRISLETDFRSFFKAILLPVCLLIFTAVFTLILFFSGVITLVLGNNLFLIAFFIINLIFLLAIICFSIVYTMEIIVKNSSVSSAIKKAIKIGFRTDNIMRTLGFLLLLLLLAILVLSFTAILMFLLSSIGEKIFTTIPDSIFRIGFYFLFMTMIWTPLKFTTLIYFYNDLNLRFEKNYPTTFLFRRLFRKK